MITKENLQLQRTSQNGRSVFDTVAKPEKDLALRTAIVLTKKQEMLTIGLCSIRNTNKALFTFYRV